MMMVGIVVGSGIFLTTGLQVSVFPSAGWVLLSWAVGGFLILAGALTYAELGTLFPEAGGQYVYLREAYGPLSGFLFGWKMFLVNMTGSIAALGVAFAAYCGYFVPALSLSNVLFCIDLGFLIPGFALSVSAGQVLAVAVIWAFSLLNIFGVALGKAVQNGLTVIKILAITAFVVLGLLAGKTAAPDLSLRIPDMGLGQILTAFGVTLVAVFWAFDGWNNINYVAGEIKDPSRSLPLVLVSGTVAVTLIYFLTNYVYFLALPLDEMTGVVRIAERAANALFGPAAAGLLSAMVLVSVAGALNGAIFVGTFEQLFIFAMFMGILFWLAAAAAVFTLRRKRPELPRPYRTLGYPVVPAIFVAALAGILVNTVIERPVQSLIGLALVLLGIPVFLYWTRKNGPAA
jgi:APA family basic amino acid/polyamine antiporter